MDNGYDHAASRLHMERILSSTISNKADKLTEDQTKEINLLHDDRGILLGSHAKQEMRLTKRRSDGRQVRLSHNPLPYSFFWRKKRDFRFQRDEWKLWTWCDFWPHWCDDQTDLPVAPTAVKKERTDFEEEMLKCFWMLLLSQLACGRIWRSSQNITGSCLLSWTR